MKKRQEPPQYAPWSTDPDPPLRPMSREQARAAGLKAKELMEKKRRGAQVSAGGRPDDDLGCPGS